MAAAVITDDPGPTDYPQPEFVPVKVELSPLYESLQAAVRARTAEHFKPVGLPDEIIEKFSLVFVQEIDAILAKFAAGHLKHGGDIRERDLMYELSCEIRDALVYLMCMRLQRMSLRLPLEL